MPAKGSSSGRLGGSGRAYGTGRKGFPTRGPVPMSSGGMGRGPGQWSIRGKSVQKAEDARFKATGVPTRATSTKAKNVAAKAAKKAGAEGPKRSAPVKKKGR
jgi:hypothetical protein